MSENSPQLVEVSFNDLPGWGHDDLAGALSVYAKTCPEHERAKVNECADNPVAAKSFFEENFSPHKVQWQEPQGLVTGYFEPVLKGSHTKTERYKIPLYKRPPDLVSLIDDKERAKFNGELSYMRQTHSGLVPYPTRKDIETGALEGQGLELLFMEDRIDTYFMHVQGSGRIDLPDGTTTRVTYAAKNGHPFSSIGKVLIERGEIAREDMCLQAIEDWLRKNEEEMSELLWINKSFIFFSELSVEDAQKGPHGAAAVPLTPERSLAVDASIHALGTPIWVSAPDLKIKDNDGFHKLMVAQDVGSAIRGPERGDIYWGSGSDAGDRAGCTNHKANFFVLLPRQTNASG